MIYSSLVIGVAQFSAFNEPLINPYALKSASHVVPISPEEPTTLALALVGIGICAAYAGLKRYVRPQQATRQLPLPIVHPDAARIESPKRGAA